jgi:hypothetical protein
MNEGADKVLKNRIIENLTKHLKFVNKKIEKIKNDGLCGGYKHCKDREFDINNEACKKCYDDVYKTLDEIYKKK